MSRPYPAPSSHRANCSLGIEVRILLLLLLQFVVAICCLTWTERENVRCTGIRLILHEVDLLVELGRSSLIGPLISLPTWMAVIPGHYRPLWQGTNTRPYRGTVIHNIQRVIHMCVTMSLTCVCHYESDVCVSLGACHMCVTMGLACVCHYEPDVCVCHYGLDMCVSLWA